MAAPTFTWSYDIDRSGADGILWKAYATLAMTTDSQGTFSSSGEALPALSQVNLQRIVRATFHDFIVDLGDTSNTLAIPTLDLTNATAPKLVLRSPTDGSALSFADPNFLNSANAVFVMTLIGEMA